MTNPSSTNRVLATLSGTAITLVSGTDGQPNPGPAQHPGDSSQPLSTGAQIAVYTFVALMVLCVCGVGWRYRARKGQRGREALTADGAAQADYSTLQPDPDKARRPTSNGRCAIL